MDKLAVKVFRMDDLSGDMKWTLTEILMIPQGSDEDQDANLARADA